MRLCHKAFHGSLLLLALGCLGNSSAMANTLLVTESGTFSSSTPGSPISSPGGTFALSFNVNSNPTVLASGPNQFDVAYTNFTFTVNGLVDSATVGSITFFDDFDGGLFSVCFTTSCPPDTSADDSLVFLGAQIFSGSTASPTLFTGSYANNLPGNPPYASVNGDENDFDTIANASITDVTPPPAVTPEPSSIYLLGTGVLGVAGMIRRRFAV